MLICQSKRLQPLDGALYFYSYDRSLLTIPNDTRDATRRYVNALRRPAVRLARCRENDIICDEFVLVA